MIAVVFPGQGSQKPGMGRALFDAFPEVRAIFDEVQEATGTDTRQLCFELDEETLRQTQNAQLALYTVSIAAFQLIPAEIRPLIGAVAGHSVGEFAAIAAAGVVSVADGARLVAKRGELMAKSGESWPGTMAAVLGLERDALQAACDAVDGVVVIANDNCPGQLVISGEIAAVEAAGKKAQELGARRVLPINVSGAFHSPLMGEPSREMRAALLAVNWSSPTIPVYANVTAAPATGDFVDLLERQLLKPVRWTETIERMLEDGVDAFIECGSGEVLSGLIKRISKGTPSFRVNDPASLEATIAALS